MPTDTALAYVPAHELRRLISQKQLSPVELMEFTLGRIDALDGQLGAYITVMGDEAMDDARAAERAVANGEELGPLHGIPVPIKDLEAVKGVTLGLCFTKRRNINEVVTDIAIESFEICAQ